MKLKPNEEIEAIVENKGLNCNRNMNKKLIRLTESDLHRVIKESVNKVQNESIDQECEGHKKMWSYINDAYNYCLNFTEDRDLYLKAFEEQTFPIL